MCIRFALRTCMTHHVCLFKPRFTVARIDRLMVSERNVFIPYRYVSGEGHYSDLLREASEAFSKVCLCRRPYTPRGSMLDYFRDMKDRFYVEEFIYEVLSANWVDERVQPKVVFSNRVSIPFFDGETLRIPLRALRSAASEKLVERRVFELLLLALRSYIDVYVKLRLIERGMPLTELPVDVEPFKALVGHGVLRVFEVAGHKYFGIRGSRVREVASIVLRSIREGYVNYTAFRLVWRV